MAERASARTTIKLGASVSAEVALYKTSGAEPELPEILKASPAGNELWPIQEVIRSVKPAKNNPLGDVPPEAAERAPVPTLEDAVTGVPVHDRDVRRGVHNEAGDFIDLTERLEDLDESVKMASMEVIAFIRQERVPRERIIGSYWLGTEDPYAAKVLRLISEGMKGANRVALCKWSKVKNQALGIIVRHGSGALLVLELEFASRIRSPNAAALMPSKVVVTDEQAAAATNLVVEMGDYPVAIDEVEDDRTTGLKALVASALDGTLTDVPVVEANPFDGLVRALTESLS